MKDYNFFEPYQKKRELHLDFKSPVFLGLIVILLIIASSVGLVVRNVILATNLAGSMEELATIQSSLEYQKAVKLQDSIAAMTEYDRAAASALERIKAGQNLNTEFLKELSGVIPSNVTIQNASLTRVNATLLFNVPNQKAAAELVDNLDRSGLFLQTTLISVASEANPEGAVGTVAQINCILKAGETE